MPASGFIGAKDGGGNDSWSCKTYEDLVKSVSTNIPNQHPAFSWLDVLPAANSVRALNGVDINVKRNDKHQN